MHWKELFQLIPEAREKILSKTVAEDINKIPLEERSNYITKSQDFLLRSRIINQYAHLAVNYFAQRVENYIENVMKKSIGVEDYIIRYEFQVKPFINAFSLLLDLISSTGPKSNSCSCLAST